MKIVFKYQNKLQDISSIVFFNIFTLNFFKNEYKFICEYPRLSIEYAKDKISAQVFNLKKQMNDRYFKTLYPILQHVCAYNKGAVSTHMKTELREWLSKEEMKKEFDCKWKERSMVMRMNEHKWKNEITKDDIDLIWFSVMKRMKLINIDSICGSEQLFRQSYKCLEWKDIQKMINNHLKLELVNMKDNIIESEKDVEETIFI
ncbi:hypothetical protein RFI_31531 [Reticulomyxa filosa]|uniref:Uncharacterized protein n=1 Tax=Reticulomyxa filosa TaxID=46433 RepID=X6LYT6_RETFI|nr:hypothetical protein RFI_31531 [Reticulomyxa filosa]|eukprot:ETO05865.1 hypothetical protein RFI_31531 [Reticulomyxa filosa]